MRLLIAVPMVLILAGCSGPSSSLDPTPPEPAAAPLPPLNATFSGSMEFGFGVESPVLSGCAGHTLSSSLTTGNVLVLDVPARYGNGTATGVVDTPVPGSSFRLCLNEQDGTNVATTTGPAPLSLTFDPPAGTLYLFLYADNTAPTAPVAAATFVLTLGVTA